VSAAAATAAGVEALDSCTQAEVERLLGDDAAMLRCLRDIFCSTARGVAFSSILAYCKRNQASRKVVANILSKLKSFLDFLAAQCPPLVEHVWGESAAALSSSFASHYKLCRQQLTLADLRVSDAKLSAFYHGNHLALLIATGKAGPHVDILLKSSLSHFKTYVVGFMARFGANHYAESTKLFVREARLVKEHTEARARACSYSHNMYAQIPTRAP
jgi:hypothetical protein